MGLVSKGTLRLDQCFIKVRGLKVKGPSKVSFLLVFRVMSLVVLLVPSLKNLLLEDNTDYRLMQG